MESSGPEGGKVRGPAAMIHERYLQLARDAGGSGDRVLSENYMQHADHYFRLWRSTQPATPPPQMNDRFADDGEGEEEGGAEMEGGEEGEANGEGGDQPDVDFPQGQQQQQNFDREGGGRNRGRGRRNRYRPEGEGGSESREPRNEGGEGGEREAGGEVREERRERQPRERRPSREPRDENAGPEGFSSGPKPAFLRGGD